MELRSDVQQNDALDDLVGCVRAGNCILFLGAGVHAVPQEADQDYPASRRPLLAGDLAEKLAADSKFKKSFPEESGRDLQRVALYIDTTTSWGRKKLITLLNQYLREGKQPSPALKTLATLPFKIVVTTNYDCLFESALRDAEKDPHVLIYDPSPDRRTRDLAEDPTISRPLVFKMHGDLEYGSSVVITDEDYITFVQRMSDKEALHPVPQTVRFRMQKWPTLFIGYSLRDYNLRLMFLTLRWRVDNADVPPCFSVDRNPDPLILRVWQDERKLVTFVVQDLWSFVPWLKSQVQMEPITP